VHDDDGHPDRTVGGEDYRFIVLAPFASVTAGVPATSR
jgi:hypothetical protein